MGTWLGLGLSVVGLGRLGLELSLVGLGLGRRLVARLGLGRLLGRFFLQLLSLRYICRVRLPGANVSFVFLFLSASQCSPQLITR